MMLIRQQKSRKKPVRQARRRQRKQEVRQLDYTAAVRTLRQFFMLVFFGLLVFGVVRSYQWLMRADTLPFRHISVTGDIDYIDREKLRRTISDNVNGGFFSLNMKQMQQSVESLPWVNIAALRRDWPDRLQVYIKEQTPIAGWQKDKYLNEFGEVFMPQNSARQPAGLPQLIGEDGREVVLLEDFIRYSKMLESVGLILVSLEEDARQDQHLLLSNQLQLVLGREDRDNRLQRFVSIYPRTLAPVANKIASLDLRYSNGFSVQWHELESLHQAKGESHA